MRMRKAAILLGVRRVRRAKRQEKGALVDAEEDDDWDYEYDLLSGDRVLVADDTNAYQLFGDVVFSCPQEDLLEGTIVVDEIVFLRH